MKGDINIILCSIGLMAIVLLMTWLIYLWAGLVWQYPIFVGISPVVVFGVIFFYYFLKEDDKVK